MTNQERGKYMITMITSGLFTISLFITGGNVLSTNFKLHHYNDEDYKELFLLKNKNSIELNCTKHSELENIKKIRRSRPDNGGSQTDYKVTKSEKLKKIEKNSD